MQRPIVSPRHRAAEEREARRQEQITRNQALITLLDLEWGDD